MLDQRRNFLAPLAQRRDVDADDVEPVVEVFAEASVGDELIEVGVGGGDDADVDELRPRLAERLDLAGFEEAQQLRLRVERHLADFVEEQRAARGGANHARRIIDARR